MLTGTIFFVVADGSREASLRFWFPNLAFVLIVTAPIVTSRLVAEEWRSRHLDILLARPIAPAALVVGKWLAAVAFFVLLLAATLVYPVFLAAWGEPDWPPIVASYLGAMLLVGLFCRGRHHGQRRHADGGGRRPRRLRRAGRRPAGQQRARLSRACRSSPTWRVSPAAPRAWRTPSTSSPP